MNNAEKPAQTDSLGKLRCVSVQFVGIPGGVVLSRGATEIQIRGEDSAAIVEIIMAVTAGTGATRVEVLEQFAAPDRRRIDNLISELLARRLLLPESSDAAFVAVEGEETGLEVLAWHFGATAAEVQGRLEERHVALVGVNGISRQLALALGASGLRHLEIVDHPLLRNRRMFPGDKLGAQEWPAHLPAPLRYESWRDESDLEAVDCVVATADFGGQRLMRSWNEFCVRNDCLFFPVVLDKMIGLVGPLVVPHETACYECLRAREDANTEDHLLKRALEEPRAAVQRQAVSGCHPSMASVLGDLAAIELYKFFGLGLPDPAGTLFEVNLLSPSLVARKVLKLPRCPVCSSLNKRPGASLDRINFVFE